MRKLQLGNFNVPMVTQLVGLKLMFFNAEAQVLNLCVIQSFQECHSPITISWFSTVLYKCIWSLFLVIWSSNYNGLVLLF